MEKVNTKMLIVKMYVVYIEINDTPHKLNDAVRKIWKLHEKQFIIFYCRKFIKYGFHIVIRNAYEM